MATRSNARTDARSNAPAKPASLEGMQRELDYYREEYNAIGARLLRLQDEQSRTAREARRSRTLAKLIRDAYRMADKAGSPGEMALMMCHTIIDDTLSDRAAIMRRLPGGSRFAVLAAAGMDKDAAYETRKITAPPPFFFTSGVGPATPVATELTRVLDAPYVLWAFDRDSGYAVMLGNRTEGHIHRPFEAGDRELVDGALSVYMDVLARKQSEYELRQAKLEAEEAGRAQARFLAKLSHELRTPMNAILGFSDMIVMAKEFSIDLEAAVAYGKDIQEAGGYLLALIDDILDFSAFGLEDPTIDRESVDPLDLIAKAEQSVRQLATSKGVAVEVNLPRPVESIAVDPVRMRQVLANLIGNAIKFTPGGGRVVVSAHQDDGADALLIDVSDTGIGLDASDIPRVFEPFVQVRDSGDVANDGVGLGLTIAKTLVEAHGGRLTLSSTPGQGAVARVILPRSPETAAQQDRA